MTTTRLTDDELDSWLDALGEDHELTDAQLDALDDRQMARLVTRNHADHGGAAGSFRLDGCALCPADEHQHEWGARIDGLRSCRRPGCDAEDYDPTWGAGIFSDWPTGTRKAHGR